MSLAPGARLGPYEIVSALGAGGPAFAERDLRSHRSRCRNHKYGNIHNHMKTTIDVPDELFVAVKQRAAANRITMRAMVERGLRAELGRVPSRRARRPAIRWVTADGGLPRGLDLADRAAMHDRLRRDR